MNKRIIMLSKKLGETFIRSLAYRLRVCNDQKINKKISGRNLPCPYSVQLAPHLRCLYTHPDTMNATDAFLILFPAAYTTNCLYFASHRISQSRNKCCSHLTILDTPYMSSSFFISENINELTAW